MSTINWSPEVSRAASSISADTVSETVDQKGMDTLIHMIETGARFEIKEEMDTVRAQIEAAQGEGDQNAVVVHTARLLVLNKAYEDAPHQAAQAANCLVFMNSFMNSPLAAQLMAQSKSPAGVS